MYKQIKNYLQILSDPGVLDERHCFSFHCVLLPGKHRFSALDPLLNVAQDRDLSNVVVVVVEDGLSQHWSSFLPTALIFKPPDPDPNTSVSGTQCHVTRPGSGIRQGRENDCYAAD